MSSLMRAAWRSATQAGEPVRESTIRRACAEVREQVVTLPSSGDQSGLCVNSVDGINLRIAGLDESGSIGTWNKDNPDARVKIGDRIVEVNGITSDTTAMIQEMKYSDTCRLRVHCTADVEHQHRLMQFRTLRPEDFELLGLLDTLNPPKHCGAPESLVASLPRVPASECHAQRCNICLDDFLSTALVTQLPCEHAFCTPCIKTWMTQYKSRCPVCQVSIDRSNTSAMSTRAPSLDSGATDDSDGESFQSVFDLDVSSEFDDKYSKSVIQMPLRALHIHGATHCQGLSTRRSRPRSLRVMNL
jgi:hypothetical protein